MWHTDDLQVDVSTVILGTGSTAGEKKTYVVPGLMELAFYWEGTDDK